MSCLPVGAAGAQARRQELVPQLEGAALVAALQKGGTVILLRHASTAGPADETRKLSLDDCSTQRNLSEEGKREAEEIGAAFRELGIQVDAVYSSPYCRTRDTGRLAFGDVTVSEELSVADDLSIEGKVDRGTTIRKMLDTPPPPGKNTVLITHTGNLLYSFGLDSRPEGIAHVFAPTGTGRANYLGRMKPSDWPHPAAAEAGVGAGQ
jgi:phosphohistidine phosphatase SixA